MQGDSKDNQEQVESPSFQSIFLFDIFLVQLKDMSRFLQRGKLIHGFLPSVQKQLSLLE